MDTDIQSQGQRVQGQGPVHRIDKTSRSRSRGRLYIALVAAFVILAGGLASWYCLSKGAAFNEDKNINHNQYQAIFLTNGQVYFGKLSDLNNKYVTVSDIYYLQVQQGQTTDGKSLQNASSTTDANTQVSLAKLGSELHGPADKMHIASDQVLFWENLTNDGKVAQAIHTYRSK